VFKRRKCTPLHVEQTIGYYDNKDFEDVADEDTGELGRRPVTQHSHCLARRYKDSQQSFN